MLKQFNITWCQTENEYPQIGTECPKCENGVIASSQYGGMWCKSCKWKWKESKFPPKSPAEKKVENTGEIMKHEEIVTGFKELNKRLDTLIEFLIKKLGKPE